MTHDAGGDDNLPVAENSHPAPGFERFRGCPMEKQPIATNRAGKLV